MMIRDRVDQSNLCSVFYKSFRERTALHNLHIDKAFDSSRTVDASTEYCVNIVPVSARKFRITSILNRDYIYHLMGNIPDTNPSLPCRCVPFYPF